MSALLLGGVAVATRALGPDGPAHPEQWDARVLDLVAFVEQARGLDFEHPVYVDFLTPEQYTAETTADGDGETQDERDDLARYAAELRALGVASGPVDLGKAFDQVSDGGTLAFYNPTDERVRVRGDEMTVGLEVTLVHELTHALQDQHFDLERLTAADLDSSASTAFRGLVEGDALRIEDRYAAEELTDDQRADYDAEYADELARSESSTPDVPPFLRAAVGAPYALGQPFALMLDNQGGNREIDRAFAEPPDTDEQLFDATSYLSDEGAVADVELGFPDGDELLDEDTFGATSWYLVLAERIDPKVAFEAVRGWNGDAFAAVEDDDGRVCVRAAFVGDTEEDEREMGAALRTWVEALPGDGAELDDVGGHPVLVSCDPGEGLDLELTGRSESSLYLPSLWGYLVADAASVVDVEQVRCYASTVIDSLDYEDIVDPEGAAFAGDSFQQTLAGAFDACS